MLFRSYRKRRAIESYRWVLGKRLRGTYGKQDHYEPHDIVATARAHGLSETFLCYALAMYCDRAAFDAYHAEQGDVACSYERLCQELHAMTLPSAAVYVPGDAVEREANATEIAEALTETVATDGGWGDGGGGYDAGGSDDGGGD